MSGREGGGHQKYHRHSRNRGLRLSRPVSYNQSYNHHRSDRKYHGQCRNCPTRFLPHGSRERQNLLVVRLWSVEKPTILRWQPQRQRIFAHGVQIRKGRHGVLLRMQALESSAALRWFPFAAVTLSSHRSLVLAGERLQPASGVRSRSS